MVMREMVRLPDDTKLLTCGNAEVLKLWDVETGVLRHTFGNNDSVFTVSSCAWFPDSTRLVCGSSDPERGIVMWDTDGNEIKAWRGTRIPKVVDLAVTPDGESMITVFSDKEIRILNLESLVERVVTEEQAITSLSVSGDGKFFIVNLSSQEIHLWDLAGEWKQPLKFTGHRQSKYVIRSCFGGLDSSFIASGSEDSQVYIWNVKNKKPLEVLSGHSMTVNCVSWNPRNPLMLASASDDQTIRIWGPVTFCFVSLFALQKHSLLFEFWYAVVRSFSGGNERREMGVHFSPCGRYLAACVACVVPHAEIDPGLQTLAQQDSGLATSPTQHPLTAHQVIYELRVYSLQKESFGSVLVSREIRAANCLTSIQFSPTSEHIMLAYGRHHAYLSNSIVTDGEATSHFFRVLEIYRVSDMELVRVLPSSEDEVNVACFHPSPGCGLVYGTKEGSLRIFQYNTAATSNFTGPNTYPDENLSEVA
ncbi:hypothetical protein F2Q68_00020037 [Brassica cretica]|uniref:Anaphase-promoting complex subunit 4 WD40 domain-containing protein n=1 Tax=Brassica cretica TaxID=69181 RepID=A0A8S9FZ91_BRACR|nr:hypothetical protein F2Q68_00020037 [Brassica cretica]